jgi:hypothetical protein
MNYQPRKNQFAPLSQQIYVHPFSLETLAREFQQHNRQQFPICTAPNTCDNPFKYETIIGIYPAVFYTKLIFEEKNDTQIQSEILYTCEIDKIQIQLQAKVRSRQEIRFVTPQRIKIFDWTNRIVNQSKVKPTITPNYIIDPPQAIDVHRVDRQKLWFICEPKTSNKTP